MKSFIKIYGPPVLKAIKTLEKVSIDMPEVCMMDTIIAQSGPLLDMRYEEPRGTGGAWTIDYFGSLGKISVERCGKIISKSGESLGEYDFFFEWFTKPTTDQVNELIEKIDETLTPLGCKYTITTER